MKLNSRKLKKLMKHFGRVESGRPKNYYEKKHDYIVDDIKNFKDSFLPRLPKIIVDTKEKEILTKVKKNFDQKFDKMYSELGSTFNSQFKEASDDLSQDEKRLYNLFADVNSLREEVGDQEEEFKGHEEDVMRKLDSIQDDIIKLESRKPLIIQRVEQKFDDPKLEEPIMTKDKRVDKLQKSLMMMQDTLNQLVDVKVEEDKMKKEEYEERLSEIDKTIKKFEMKLIRLQTKKNSKELKPLINKIAQLKNKYSKMALRIKSRTSIRVRPLHLRPLPGLPDHIPKVKQMKHRKMILPGALDLPDITQESSSVKFELPEPVPKFDMGSMPKMPARHAVQPKKKGFLGFFK